MKQIHEVKPYTYLVKFKPTGKVYYGSRCRNYTKFNRTPADDFWHIYTTSSNTINDLIEEYGKDAFEYEIRRTFDTVEEMSAWETKVLKRCRVLERQDVWMNSNVAGKKILTEAGAKVISATHKGKPKSEDHKKNMSAAQKGKPKKSTVYQSQEYKELMSKLKTGAGNGRYGKEVSELTRQRISDAKKGKQVAHNKGVPMTEAQKQKLRDKMLGRKVDTDVVARRVAKQTGQKREKLFCPHCKRDIAVGWYNRHGDNCQSYK
jgi:ribosomal protein L37AE/L43A